MDIIKDDYFEDSFVALLEASDVVIVDAAPKKAASSTEPEPEEDPDDPEDPEEEPELEINRFEAIAQEADKKNLNNRIYPKAVLQSALDALQPKLKRKEVFAMSDHPSMFEGPRIGRIAAIINEASLNDKGKVVIKGEFVDNEAAKEVKSLLKMGVKVGVSARGYGEYDTDSKTGTMTFKDGYELEGWDFVVYPAANAKVTHFESENKADISKEETKVEIKTLDELRAAYPELVASLEKPLNDKIAELTAQIAELDAKIAGTTTTTTELQEKLDELTARHDATLKALDEAAGKLQIATDENTKMKADIAAAELKAATDALLKDNKYAQFIKIDASLDSIDKVKAYVDAETAKFDAFAATVKPAAPVVDAAPAAEEVVAEEPKAKAEDTQSEIKAPEPKDPVMDLYVDLAVRKSSKLL